MDQVPLIDIARALAGDPAARKTVAAEIGKACESVGFLMVTGHGIARGLIDEAIGLSKAFFELPLEEKLRIAIGADKPRRGYRLLGETYVASSLGAATPHDLREQFITGPEPVPGDTYYLRPGAARFFPPNVWPERPAGLQQAWSGYYAAANRLAGELMRLFALALGLPGTFFDDKIDHHITQLISVNYPEQPDEPRPGQLRAGAHSDFGSLTLLATEDAPGGLQVRMPDGHWRDVAPVDGAFIVNIGDLMAQWTNDRWRSTLHRVVNPPRAVAATSRRHSLVFFHQPNFDARIACLPTCLAPGERPKHPPITSGDHLAQQLARITQAAPKPREPALS